MKSYIVIEGPYHGDGYPVLAFKSEEAAEQRCREDGYKYSKSETLWKNGERWRRVEEIDYYE